MYWKSESEMKYFKTTVESSVSQIKKYGSDFVAKDHYNKLGKSNDLKIRHAIDELIYSNSKVDGFFLMADNIDTEKLSKHLYEGLNIELEYPIFRGRVALILQKRVNELYREVLKYNKTKRATIASSFNCCSNKKQSEIKKSEFFNRCKIGVKIIRIK